VKTNGLEYDSTDSFDQLLCALAEHIKLPLTQISQMGELARLTGSYDAYLESIGITAAAAIQLVDGYLLSKELARRKEMLAYEPVAIAAVLEDTAHKLRQLAAVYDCELKIHIKEVHVPVLANRDALETAFASLGQAFLESPASESSGSAPGPMSVTFAAHRTHHGIVAGIFTDMDGLSNRLLARARKLYGRSGQPFNAAMPGGAAGVFIADSILSSMSARLRYASHNRVPGLAATLVPSRQLSLV
jgi:hypothetical protein